ncbi:MAG: amidohydrolase family protein [Chloroflexota bacterium]
MKALIAVARGEQPADLILANGRIINTFPGQVETGNVAIYEGRVAGIGSYHQGKAIMDLKGSYLAPGFIDGHVHLESSYLHPVQYARAVMPRGTTTIITDLHEIANVAGLRGIRFYLRWARRLPMDFYFMAPSCVPATPRESSGATLGVAEIRSILGW